MLWWGNDFELYYSSNIRKLILYSLDGSLMFYAFWHGQSNAQIANNIRILQHLKEVEERFSKHDIQSSIMSCKQNLLWLDLISSLFRFVQSLFIKILQAVCTQWLGRTLDNMASRSFSFFEAFLTIDPNL